MIVYIRLEVHDESWLGEEEPTHPRPPPKKKKRLGKKWEGTSTIDKTSRRAKRAGARDTTKESTRDEKAFNSASSVCEDDDHHPSRYSDHTPKDEISRQVES